MTKNHFFYHLLRTYGILKKEFYCIKRDWLTHAFLIFIPFMEVLLFGYIINTNPEHLPTLIMDSDKSYFSRNFVNDLQNTQYFDIAGEIKNEKESQYALKSGKALFVLNIPTNFSHDLVQKKQPHILLEGDATDPVAIINAFNAANTVIQTSFNHYLQGAFSYLLPDQQAVILDTHAKYNPSMIAQYHSLPGLLVTVLTFTLVMVTAISISSEYEYGTMEILLLTPIKPLEVIIGKIIPQLIIGYLLIMLTLSVTYWLFHVPFYGNIFLFFLAAFPFLLSNLSVGIAVSTVSKTQFRAANIANAYSLPCTLLSGFLMPFYGMPHWAQVLGNLLPPTHFLRISSGIMLKGNGLKEIWPDLWPIIAFVFFMMGFSIYYYRSTLD